MQFDEEAAIDEQTDDGPEQPEPQLRAHQFSLIGLFALITCCGVYFFLEKAHDGQFGLHALAGVALVVGLALPALWLTAWVLRTIIDAGASIAIALLAVAIVGAVLFALTRFPGF